MRLRALMFLEHLCLGTWSVTLGSYLGALAKADGPGGLEPSFIGLAYGTFAVGMMVSPFLAGLLADRRFSSERLLAVIHAMGAVTLLGVTFATTPAWLYLALLAHFIFVAPVTAIVNSTVMKNVDNPQKSFPLVRLWGTIGWICSGLLVGWVVPALFFGGESIEATAWPLWLAAAFHLATAVFCRFLPHTPPVKAESRGHLVTDLRSLATHRKFLALLAFAFLIGLPSQFYYGYANLFFNELHVDHAAAKMALGQGVEIGAMLLLPLMLTRLGIRATLLMGIAAWAVRYYALAACGLDGLAPLLYVGILLHGVSFTFVSVSLQIYLDREAVGGLRATAQGVFSFCNHGVGKFLGANLTGIAHGWLVGSAAAGAWGVFWLAPAIYCTALLLAAAVVFRNGRRARAEAPCCETANGIPESG